MMLARGGVRLPGKKEICVTLRTAAVVAMTTDQCGRIDWRAFGFVRTGPLEPPLAPV